MSKWFQSYGFADVHGDLLVGAYPLDGDDVSMLHRIGVERILNLVEESEYRPGERSAVRAALDAAGIIEERMDLIDYGGLPSTELEAAVQRVLGWLNEGHRVYLHCRAGWQRSAAVAAGVVAIREQLGIDEALAVVQSRKPSADPLPHQREDLVWWWEERVSNQPEDGPSQPEDGSHQPEDGSHQPEDGSHQPEDEPDQPQDQPPDPSS